MLLLGLGACLAVMNTSFYLALERLPMSLVAAMEFVGTIAVALYGLRSGRNLAALALSVLGVLILIDLKWSTDPAGLFWSALNLAEIWYPLAQVLTTGIIFIVNFIINRSFTFKTENLEKQNS